MSTISGYTWNGSADNQWGRVNIEELTDGSKALVVTDLGSTVSTGVTNTSVTVGATSTAVLSANSDRNFVEIVNDSDEVIYLKLGSSATMNSGIRINANGGSFWIGKDNLYTGAITAICASGSKNITVVEG